MLQINSVCGIGSTGRIVTDIAQELIENNHECKIAYGRAKAPKKFEDISYKFCSNFDFYIQSLESRIFDNHGFSLKKGTSKLINFIEDYNPDIIHMHNLHGYYINIEMLLNYLSTKNIKVVYTLHDCWSFSGHCAYFSAVQCDKWKTGCYGCIQKKTYPKSLLLDNSGKNWNKKKSVFSKLQNLVIVTPSEWLASLVKESFLSFAEIKVINNSVDTSIFYKHNSHILEDNYGIKNKKILLGVASGWSERKGLKDFIKLSTLLDDEYMIVVVGVNKEQKKHLPSTIIGIEQTSNVDVLACLYSESDYFLNLTYEDNYPTTNLEAQACGTPCITYNTGGSSESVPQSNIVNQGDLEEVCKKIKQKLPVLASKGDNMCQNYLKLYEKLISV